MPGNPLPKIEINASRWPYDENGPVNGKFGQVVVTPAAKAVFDAANGPTSSNGYLQTKNGDMIVDFPPEAIEDTGEIGFPFYRQAKPNAFDDNKAKQFKLRLSVPQFRFFESFRIYQPSNYYHRGLIDFESTDTAITDLWEVGDTVQAQTGETATVYQVGGTGGHSETPVVLNNYGGSATGNPTWGSGRVITNLSKGTSVTSGKASVIGANNKFSIWWVDDGDSNDGYSNGAMNFELDATRDGTGNSKMKVTGEGTMYSDDYPQAGEWIENQSGTLSNQLSGEPSQPLIFDTQYNGSFIRLVCERKRSDSLENPNGEFRVWAKTENGGLYPEWKLIYEITGIAYGMYDINNTVGNKFTDAYLSGPANSGFAEDTTIYMTDYEVWLEKPTSLTEAGV